MRNDPERGRRGSTMRLDISTARALRRIAPAPLVGNILAASAHVSASSEDSAGNYILYPFPALDVMVEDVTCGKPEFTLA